MFDKSKLAWFKSFLDLPGGVPSHDTFGRVSRCWYIFEISSAGDWMSDWGPVAAWG